MRNIILSVVLLITSTTMNGQIFKELYKDFLKYGTVYAAGDISNSVEAIEPTYVLERTDNVYEIPIIKDNTEVFPFDYRYGFGIRKLARFDYERKPKNFYDGTESQLAFTAPTSAFKGLEYQFHFEKERWRGRDFTNYRYFLKHTGKHHIVKVETRQVENINVNYNSAEARFRLPIGKKFSISAGAIVRGHDRAYGYNPIEIYLNETTTDENGNEFPTNYWFGLANEYGYSDNPTTYTDNTTGEEFTDYLWRDEDGNIVAFSDADFRERIFPSIMNEFNGRAWDLLDPWVEVAPIIGFDFYHYKSDFWFHAYGNYILPYHQYIAGEKDFSYLHRNSWGKGGHNNLLKGEQWHDYSFGINLGTKVGKNLGIFVEGEYSKMWDSRLYQTTFGVNYTFK